MFKTEKYNEIARFVEKYQKNAEDTERFLEQQKEAIRSEREDVDLEGLLEMHESLGSVPDFRPMCMKEKEAVKNYMRIKKKYGSFLKQVKETLDELEKEKREEIRVEHKEKTQDQEKQSQEGKEQTPEREYRQFERTKKYKETKNQKRTSTDNTVPTTDYTVPLLALSEFPASANQSVYHAVEAITGEGDFNRRFNRAYDIFGRIRKKELDGEDREYINKVIELVRQSGQSGILQRQRECGNLDGRLYERTMTRMEKLR